MTNLPEVLPDNIAFDVALKLGTLDSAVKAVWAEAVATLEAAKRQAEANSRRWTKGQEIVAYCRYGREHKREIVAGLFAYSGFGMGNYYSRFGDIVWTGEPNKLAKKEGVELIRFDPF